MLRDMVKVGTSGIIVPGNKTTFPDEYRSGSRLHYYGSLFNTLEINSSFYKIPLASTFAKWATEVPDNFKFTVKLWQGITHTKKLLYSATDIDNFMQAANCLGEKAGCLLIQFPASISASFVTEVESIIDRLSRSDTCNQWRLAIEFRHTSWYQKVTYDLLDKYQASQVIHDMPNSKTPAEYEPKDLAYFRFHGPTGNYNGSYNTDFITDCAQQINLWRKHGKEIYAYFNNTMGNALQNAQLLQKLL